MGILAGKGLDTLVSDAQALLDRVNNVYNRPGHLPQATISTVPPEKAYQWCYEPRASEYLDIRLAILNFLHDVSVHL